MRVIIFSLLHFLSCSDIYCQNYQHLFEIRGFEDVLGNTHLFYRYGGANTICWTKDIYHFDVVNSIDTFFINDSGHKTFPGSNCQGEFVNDYEFFDNDFSKFFYCGYHLWIDPVALLVRYDGEIQIPAFVLTDLEISSFNENLVYVSAGPVLFKSTDGGYNFEIHDSIQTIDASIISISRNDNTQIYGIDDNKLARSEDEGESYIIVDDYQLGNWISDRELYYDTDEQHIYYVVNSNLGGTLRVSDNNGNPNSWNTVVIKPSIIYFTFDEENTGEIYYSFRKGIYKSTDYGASFLLYKELDRKVTGLYKKSGSDILYASTPLKIYEITPDTTQVIKTLPVPEEILNLYPLSIGNKWVYDYLIDQYDPGMQGQSGIYIREVLGDTILANGKLYAKVYDETLNYYGTYVYERVDSLSGKVFRYYEDPLLEENEYAIHDLLAEVGDTIITNRNFYGESLYTTVLGISIFSKWGITKPKKIYQEYSLSMLTYSLTEKFGLDSIFFIFDFGYGRTELKGAIIDGVVYGDTITVSVDDEVSGQPLEFSLSQNYPNPFNPTTKIKFTIPTSPLNPSPYQGEGNRERFITLKVFDVLGNEASTLVNEEKPTGEYEVEFNATGLPSGIYFYQLRADSFVQTKKMLLLK